MAVQCDVFVFARLPQIKYRTVMDNQSQFRAAPLINHRAVDLLRCSLCGSPVHGQHYR